jgi:hypothetical protein
MAIGGRTIGLILRVAMGALVFLALAIPAVATAESTALCKEDPGEASCPKVKVATHVHVVSTTKSKVETNWLTVECDTLFLGDGLTESGEPLLIQGNFTYSNCGSCTVKEENGPSEIKVLKEGHETATVTGEGLVHVVCGSSLDCSYIGTGLSAAAKGPLLASHKNGEVSLSSQTVTKEAGGFLCPKSNKLTLLLTPLEALYITWGETTPHKTALCTADDSGSICLEEHKPSTIDFKDSAAEFLTNLANSKCEALVSSTSIGEAGGPQQVGVEYKFSNCTNECVITEVSGGSKLAILLEFGKESPAELASVTPEGLEIFFKCGETVKCVFDPAAMFGHGLGALATKDNGHITFSKQSLGKGEGLLCPTEASMDALFVASSPIYFREEVKLPTSLCSKDETSPVCKSENQLKTIDYKDKAVELLTNLINVKCEGLVSGSVGEPASPLEIKPELTYSNCSGGCFVTSVAGPGKILLQREGKSEEAKATSEGFEIFVKCGTTIKCLLGPEKITGTALGALTTGDNGHLTFSKASLGKGEGATCPKEATLDALYVPTSAAYIG